MPALIVGPLLRYVSETEASVWVETDAPCELEVLGASEETFCVNGHHYALVCIDGLEPGTETEYEVRLDGEVVWPEPGTDLPPCAIKTLSPDSELRLSFGSCRVALPHERPYTLTKDEDDRGAESDALHVLARELIRDPESRWPSLLLMLGDQVYVDEGSPRLREEIRARRDTSQPPGDEVIDFEDYTQLYRESWTEPLVRWLFSTVPTAMAIDDHDMSDDWNISRSWAQEMEQKDWWQVRFEAGIMTYWLYQHLGNLSPSALADDELFAAVRERRDDATEVVREYARRAHTEPERVRWSYKRDLLGTRVLVVDSRGGRVLEPDRRAIVDDTEREWVWSKAQGDFDHLILATSVPFLLTPALHYLEAWNEAVCDGVWGERAARLAEKMRRAVDFDHWSAFGESFANMTELLRRVGSGEWGDPPASIVLLSGDVHHAYLADMAFPRGSGVRSAVYQAVCSPFRNPLDKNERRVIRLALTKPALALTRGLARAAGVKDPELRWRFAEGPCFDNQVGTVHIDGRSLELVLERTDPDEVEEASLKTSFRRRLA